MIRAMPVLVMDVWEHAFLLDYKPPERQKYIEAFFSNINWYVVQTVCGRTKTRSFQPNNPESAKPFRFDLAVTSAMRRRSYSVCDPGA